MHVTGVLLLAIVIGLTAGALLGTQPSINGLLARNVEHPLQASFISLGSGALVLMVACLVIDAFPPQFKVPVQTLPWWIWTGGSIGVVLVTTSLIFVPKIGSLPWFAAVISGQIIAAILLDHFGLLGNPKTAATPLRLLGAALLLAGVFVIVVAKRVEQRAINAASSHAESERAVESANQR